MGYAENIPAPLAGKHARPGYRHAAGIFRRKDGVLGVANRVFISQIPALDVFLQMALRRRGARYGFNANTQLPAGKVRAVPDDGGRGLQRRRRFIREYHFA